MAKSKTDFFLFLLLGIISVPLYLAFCYFITIARAGILASVGINRINILDLLASYFLAFILGFLGGSYLLGRLSEQTAKSKDIYYVWIFSGGLFFAWTVLQTISQTIGFIVGGSKLGAAFIGSVAGAVFFLVFACGVIAWSYKTDKSEDEEKSAIIQGITPKTSAEMPEVKVSPQPDFSRSRMWKIAPQDLGVLQLQNNGDFTLSGILLSQVNGFDNTEINGVILNKKEGIGKELEVKNLDGRDLVFKFEKGKWLIKHSA